MASVGVVPSAVILEPKGRNTAATAALAALIAQDIDPAAHVLLAPADHLVANAAAFVETIRAACAVLPERIVTFGISPAGPETGFGYIQQGEQLADGVYAVTTFKEKPKGDGGMINGGFFVLSPSVISLITDDSTVWEQGPLESLACDHQIAAYEHTGFWQPMDTLRDKRTLESIWENRSAPWLMN
jgi:UTP-glucose-1-phosphate uridylyltransferase